MSGVEDADVHACRKFLIREKKKNPTLLWILGDSFVESCGCKKENVKNGKVGRPKKVITGKLIKRHVHIFILSIDDGYKIEEELFAVQNFLKNQRKRKPHLRQYKTKQIRGMSFCKYIARQSQHLYRCSDYDWNYFLSEEYME